MTGDWRDNPRPVPGVTRAQPVETSTATPSSESRCTCDAVNAAFANGRERALSELRESEEWKAMGELISRFHDMQRLLEVGVLTDLTVANWELLRMLVEGEDSL